MSHYHRVVVPGGTYFFTVRMQDRRSDLLVRRVDLLRQCVSICKERWPFEIEAAVILPDHLHMIWTLPSGDGDYSKRWRLIKSTFSRHVDPPSNVRASLLRRGEKGIWQRRFWEHLIRNHEDFLAHEAYLHAAPVRAGLVARPDDWTFSSIRRQRFVAQHDGLAAQAGYGPVTLRVGR